MNCGNMNFNKAMEMNPDAATPEPTTNSTEPSKKEFKKTKSSQPTERTVTAEEADVYFT